MKFLGCGILLGSGLPAAAVLNQQSSQFSTAKQSFDIHVDDTASRRRNKEMLIREAKKETDAEVATKTDKKTKKTKKQGVQAEDIAGLFRGEDFADDSAIVRELLSQSAAPEVSSTKPVHIFGLQNAGTSLLWAMMHLNFGNQVEFHGYDQGKKKDNKDMHKPGVWKFANLKELHAKEKDTIAQLNENFQQNGVLSVIAMIRDPYAWLQAMRTKSADALASCVEGDDWLTKQCLHEQPAGPVTHMALTVEPRTYPNFPNVWNNWVRDFTNATEYGFMRRLVLTYENLVKNPDRTMDRIAQFLSVSGSGPWKIPFADADAKAIAEEDISARKYMDVLTPVEKQQACMRLDKGVMGLYGYPVEDCISFTQNHAEPVSANHDSGAVAQAKDSDAPAASSRYAPIDESQIGDVSEMPDALKTALKVDDDAAIFTPYQLGAEAPTVDAEAPTADADAPTADADAPTTVTSGDLSDTSDVITDLKLKGPDPEVARILTSVRNPQIASTLTIGHDAEDES